MVVPDAFFKVVFDVTPPFKMMSFIAPNADSGLSLDICSYTSTVKTAESLSKTMLFSIAIEDDPAI